MRKAHEKIARMETLKIALVGAGYIADYHVRGLLELPHVEITAVVSKRLENAQRFALKYNIKYAYSQISKIMEDSAIDAVVISTPNALHAPQAIEFLKNGKDVFIEKPMALNAIEGERINKAAEKYGQLVMVGHMWRFDTDTRYIKDAIDADKLGTIFKTKSYGIHENWGPTGWFVQKKAVRGWRFGRHGGACH